MKPVRQRRGLAALPAQPLIDTRRLLTFFHVARLGSLSAAQPVLGIAQSAISRQLQQLEAETGDRLLVRNGRGVTLTPAGDILWRHAESMLRTMSAATAELEELRRRPAAGSITIASPPTFSNVYMPEVVRRFATGHPQVRLVAYEASTGQVFDYLAAGQVDLAIVLHRAASERLTLRRLVVEPLMLIVGAGHRLAGCRVIARERLAELDMVLPVAAHGSRALIEAYCEAGGLVLEPRMRLDSLGMTKAVLRDGTFGTILPLVACAEEVARGELKAIALAPALRRTVYLASLRDRPLSPAARALAREIGQVVRARIHRGSD
jgi:LysR family nitrogen assimilation transcriptional regulator